MSNAVRADLIPHLKAAPDHAGLWLDRFMPELSEVEKTKPVFFDKACQVPEPAVYRLHYEAWKQALVESGALLAEGRVGLNANGKPVPGRMIVGLGSESVLETSVTLHRTYGVPFIPGSALKGLAASFAHRRLEDPMWKEEGRAHRAAFGTTEAAGCLVFHDALYIPGSGVNRRALHEDVMAVHHPPYYRGEDVAPADWDSPIPVHFLTSTGSYLVAVSGPPIWSQKALDILALALAEEGVGAKTSRGYGRITLTPTAAAPTPASGGPSAAASFQSVSRVAALPKAQVKSQMGMFVQQWKNLSAGPEKTLLAKAILAKITEAGWKDADSKPWYPDLKAFAEQ